MRCARALGLEGLALAERARHPESRAGLGVILDDLRYGDGVLRTPPVLAVPTRMELSVAQRGDIVPLG